jgi:hypothetical protein
MSRESSCWIHRAAILTALAWASGSAAYDCPRFASQEWTFTGHLVNRIFPGPPDFESVSSGDEPVTRWYLQLSWPACFAEFRYLDRFQLALSPEEVARFGQFLGKEIRVTGSLTEGLGAHSTALVVNVTRLDALRRQDRDASRSY